MELVYRLNLPKFEEILIKGASLPQDDDLKYNYLIFDTLQFIKKEYLTIEGINFRLMLYFKKNNTTGTIHTDSHNHPTVFRWGINWIVEGIGIMEYWNFDQVHYLRHNDAALNDPTFRGVPTFIPKAQSPCKRYIMHPGAYLINATIPHRALAENNRKCVSIRPTTEFKDWDEVVTIFDKLIIK